MNAFNKKISPFNLVSRIIIGGSAHRHSLPPYYLFKLTSSCNISSDVVIILVFAWKPRWAVIISVNSSAKSTFDISREPLAILAAPSLSASTKPARPALFVSRNKLPPIFSRPPGLENRSEERRVGKESRERWYDQR